MVESGKDGQIEAWQGEFELVSNTVCGGRGGEGIRLVVGVSVIS